ncbi:MAG TPA: hypothetical protein VGR90_11160, partial [Acidimicrobiales bacterium]|nr:hypothetical protein [Acidimicrobiales bacterium]
MSRAAPAVTALALVAVAAAIWVVPTTASGPAARADAGVPVVAVDGRGFGHGVGLSQDGALWMGRAGAGTLAILGQFFPGTSLSRSGGQIRVQVLSAAWGDATVEFPSGGQVQDAYTGQQSPGFPYRVPAGGTVVLQWAGGRYTVGPPPSQAQVSSQSLGPAITIPSPPTSTTSTTAP